MKNPNPVSPHVSLLLKKNVAHPGLRVVASGGLIRRYAAGVCLSALFLGGVLVSRAVESGGYEWMPAEAEHAGASGGGAAPLRKLTEVSVPKPTADASKFTKVYTLELEKFGIRNDGTEADATSRGINAALQHAKTVGANKIVFPAGTYLISEKAPIEVDHQDTIIDLGGATLQIRANGLPNYAVVEILPGAKNLRLTNGTIRGDRDEHDYGAGSNPSGEGKTVKDTHEGGICLSVIGGDHLEIDHLHLTKATGDGAGVSSTGARNRDELLQRIYHDVTRKNLESGGFSDRGEKVANPEKVRSVEPYAIGGERNQFELGYLAGYMGFPWILGRAYQVYFFDAGNRFLEKKDCLQYRKVQVPEKARFMHVEFNQSEVSDKPAHAAADEWMVRINNFTPSTDVHFHDNLMDFNRRLGFTGAGIRWLIERNRFENNGGTAPAYGIDLEDGWEMMQDVVIRKNTFKGNQIGDIVICAGSEILVEDNDFTNKVVFHGRAYNYTVRGNRMDGGSVFYTTRSGVATITGNRYRNIQRIEMNFDAKGFADGFVRKEGEKVATPALLATNETLEEVKQVTGTFINFRDSRFTNSKLVAGESTRLVSLENCVFENTSLEVKNKGPEFVIRKKNNTGDLSITGGGQHRMLIKE